MATVTKKTLILKRPPTEPAEPSAEAETAAATDLPPAAVIRQPADATEVEGRSYRVDAVCALLAVLMLLALLGVQWMEHSFYRDAFPNPAALVR